MQWTQQISECRSSPKYEVYNGVVMAEGDGIIQEKKFDFTPEWEVVWYISQEQASLSAMQHARDNREFYGRRYAQRDRFIRSK